MEKENEKLKEIKQLRFKALGNMEAGQLAVKCFEDSENSVEVQCNIRNNGTRGAENGRSSHTL